MGKVTCVACNQKCKGQAIKLSDNNFFHPKCFTCKECKKELPSNAFFVHNRAHYCTQDYQRLFGTKCHSCDKYVEGEVVTVMEKTFHRQCIVCSKCRQNIGAGNKLRVLNGEFLCQSCISEAENERKKEKLSKPMEDLTLKSPEPMSIGRDQITSPDSDIGADMRDGDDPTSPDIRSPASATSGYKSDVSVDLDLSGVESLQDKGNAFSPDNSTYAPELRPPSQQTANGHHEFGKFYPASFLDKGTSFKRGPSINLREKSQQHFHRPGDFSYRTVRSDIVIKHIRTAGMMNRLDKRHTASSFQRTGDPPYKPNKSQEPIQLAKIPDAQRFSDDHEKPIEREDFVARPETAAVRPELLRDLSFRVKSLPNGDVVDAKDNKENENEGTLAPPDPKTVREINELSKISSSGAAQFMLEELRKKKSAEQRDLDPISSSRMPSAAAEPFKRTRYESPIFASPSRDVLRKKFWQFEEDRNNRNRKCYTPSAPRPGYGLLSRTLHLRNGAVSEMAFRGGGDFDRDFDPGSGRNSTPGVHSTSLGLKNGYVSDTTDGYYPSNFMSYYRRPTTSCSDRAYTPVSDAEEYDPNTGLRVTKSIFRRLNILVDGRLRPSSRTSLRRSVPTIFSDQEGTKIYPYEKLRLDAKDRPPGLDNSALEQYLGDDEFEELFKMSLAEFMILAEWKRNDLKKRVMLFESSSNQPPTFNTSLEKPPTPMAT